MPERLDEAIFRTEERVQRYQVLAQRCDPSDVPRMQHLMYMLQAHLGILACLRRRRSECVRRPHADEPAPLQLAPGRATGAEKRARGRSPFRTG